jgi:phosphonate utilization transcriptional regulator
LVQSEIERLILTGELVAGEKLNENAIANRLGISRGPVRESFRTLEEMGLVRLEKNRGVFVREISAEEAAELYEVRAALDQIVGRRLASGITADQLQHLRSLVDRMDDAAQRGDVDTYHPLNVQLHERLVEFSGNRKLAAIYRRLVNELTLFRRHTLAHFETMAVSNAEHHAILDSIAAGDPAAAGEAMRDHILGSSERTQRALRLYFKPDRCGDAA